MTDESEGAAGTALTDSKERDDNQSFESSDKPENLAQSIAHVPKSWVCCMRCERWVPTPDGRTCAKCGADTFNSEGSA